MAGVKDVSGTAFVVAEFRAEENHQLRPLYRDPVVEMFLDEDTRHAAKLIADSFPPVKDMVRIRTKYLDDTLDRHIASGFRQVVILGAGLDTRAVRKQAAGVTYFEIDDAATIRLKQVRYDQRGIDADVRLMPGNYVTDGLMDLLARNGFEFGFADLLHLGGQHDVPPAGDRQDVLTAIKTAVPRFRVSFDYMTEAVITRTTGDADVTKLVDSFAQMGAPWLTGIDDVGAFARGLGLSVVENVRTADLYREYWVGRPMTSPISTCYRSARWGPSRSWTLARRLILAYKNGSGANWQRCQSQPKTASQS